MIYKTTTIDLNINKYSFQYTPTFPIKAMAIMKGQVTNPTTSTVSKISGTIRFQQDVFLINLFNYQIIF